MKISSEDQILALLDEYFDPAPSTLTLGRGDDCAEFSVSGVLALSTDLFLEDAHFRRRYFLPEEIGHKALAVNLSDLAAAGADPLAFSLGLICPPDLEVDWLRALFSGMSVLAGRHGLALSGGDLSAGDRLGFCITLWGRPVGRLGALRRGALPGQDLFVVGPGLERENSACSLGLARLGLSLLEGKGRSALADYPGACTALLRPDPQVEAGKALASLVSRAEDLYLMDVSDGLMRDLPRLLRGSVRGIPPGADLDLSSRLLHPELRAFAAACPVPPASEPALDPALGLALSGGDDYLLLGAAASELLPRLDAALRDLPSAPVLTRIGRVEKIPGLRCQGLPLEQRAELGAFDHFG
ncbi:MAG: AIR synthase related protein [Desulfovibrionaceae bacterium]|nr:AIR synthase related protein [Desulfovibrionaceae bacterium]